MSLDFEKKLLHEALSTSTVGEELICEFRHEAAGHRRLVIEKDSLSRRCGREKGLRQSNMYPVFPVPEAGYSSHMVSFSQERIL